MIMVSVMSLAFPLILEFLLIYVVKGVTGNDGCGKYVLHVLMEGTRCCRPIECPHGYIPVICKEGLPESTSCTPCDGSRYYMDKPNQSVDGKTCKHKSILKCTLSKGQIHVYDPGVDHLDNTRDTGRCVCSTKHNYIPHPGYTDMCLFCGNGSGHYVDNNGDCRYCDGAVVYHPETSHVSCIPTLDSTSTSHQTDGMVPYTSRDVSNPNSTSVDEHAAPYGGTLGHKLSTMTGQNATNKTIVSELSDKTSTILSVVGGCFAVAVVLLIFFIYVWCNKHKPTSADVSTDGSSISSQPKTVEEMARLNEDRVGDEDEVSFQTTNEEHSPLYGSGNEAMETSTEGLATSAGVKEYYCPQNNAAGAMTASSMTTTPVESIAIVSDDANKDDTVLDVPSICTAQRRTTEPGHQPVKAQATADPSSDNTYRDRRHLDPAVSTVVNIDTDASAYDVNEEILIQTTTTSMIVSPIQPSVASSTITPMVHGLNNSIPGYTDSTSTGHPSANNMVRTPPAVHREQSGVTESPGCTTQIQLQSIQSVHEPHRYSTQVHGTSASDVDDQFSFHSDATQPNTITDGPIISLDGPPCDHGILPPSCSTRSSSDDGPMNGATPDVIHTGDTQVGRDPIRDYIHMEHGDNMEEGPTQVKQPNGPPSTSDLAGPPTNGSLPNGVPPNQHVGDLHLQNGGITGNAIVGANINGGSINVNITSHNYYGLNNSGDTKSTAQDCLRNTDR